MRRDRTRKDNKHACGLDKAVSPKARHHGCTDKKTYLTRQQAKRARLKYERVYGVRHTIYRCENCGGYHLTTHGRLSW